MANFDVYALSLRADRGPQDRSIEEGVPFFVPQLAKVKTNVMCQRKNQHLLFCYEKTGSSIGSGQSYRKQGNQDFYTEDNLKKRQKLLEDKQVLASIARFWDTFPHIRQGHQYLDKEDYIDVFMKFYKALVTPNEFSIGEARKIVERDWDRDIGEAQVMTKISFYRALFEVADIWTVGIGADVYVSFLTKLYDRVTMTVFDQEKSMWLTVFADLDKVRSFVELPKDAVGPITNQDSMETTFPVKDTGVIVDSSRSPGPNIKSKPPMLRKKTMSVPAGLGSSSPTKSMSLLESYNETPTMGGSMRRLPELHAPINDAPALSPKQEKSQILVDTPTLKSGSSITSNDDQRSNSSPAKSSYERSASVRRNLILQQPPSLRTISEDTVVANDSDEAMVSDIPTPQVRLSMPSIYLSPEISVVHPPERAARRRMRESMKLAQRLRRITF